MICSSHIFCPIWPISNGEEEYELTGCEVAVNPTKSWELIGPVLVYMRRKIYGKWISSYSRFPPYLLCIREPRLSEITEEVNFGLNIVSCFLRDCFPEWNKRTMVLQPITIASIRPRSVSSWTPFPVVLTVWWFSVSQSLVLSWHGDYLALKGFVPLIEWWSSVLWGFQPFTILLFHISGWSLSLAFRKQNLS